MTIRDFLFRTWLQADDALGRARLRALSTRERRELKLDVLEDRILMSAAPAAAVLPGPETADVVVVDVEQLSAASETSSTSDTDNPAAGDSEQSDILDSVEREFGTPVEAAAANEIVFVDTSADDYEQLVRDLQSASDRQFEVVLLDADRDGIEQISEALAGRDDISAVHIVSHGTDGAVKLGNTWLTAGNFGAYARLIGNWADALTADADILFYGCDLGSDDAGRELVESLSVLTEADVAASDDLTGHADLGGDWELEVTAGTIETDVAFSDTVRNTWGHVLATLNVTQTADVVNGDTSSTSNLIGDDGGDGISLREAILAANTSGFGNDTIQLTPGTYVLSLGGADDTANAGDLDITRDLTIIGAGSGVTVIDASGLTGVDADRVFHVLNNADVVMEGITVTGGSQGKGGGIYVSGSANLTIRTSTIVGNSAGSDDGGGIFNDDGVLDLTDVTITGNSASGKKGGGLDNRGIATLTRVTISGNTAKDGGGINTEGGGSHLTLTNVTISGNGASDKGGGLRANENVDIVSSTIAFNVGENGAGIHRGGGTVTLQSTILSNNTHFDTTSENVTGTITSLGYNIDSDGTAGLGGVGDQSGTDPLLDPTLSLNGGLTETHALQAGSIAIDMSSQAFAASTDQRALLRGADPDVGSFESNSVSFSSAAEFLVNQTTGAVQETSNENRGSANAVALVPNGEYVVVWSSNQTSGSDGDGYGVLMRRYSGDGTPITGELQVNTNTSGDQHHASVAVDNTGRGVVVWTDTDVGDIKARLFHANGTFNGGEFIVNGTPGGPQTNSAVAMDANGNFVVVWEGNGPGDNDGIFAQRFDASGTPVGTQLRVNDTTFGVQGEPSVDMNLAGQFVVVWDESGSVYAHAYDDDGTDLSGEVVVEAASGVDEPDVAINNSGQFVVVWNKDVGGLFEQGVYRRTYQNDGTPLTGIDVVNTQSFGDQMHASISMDPLGNHIVAWHGAGFTDGSGVVIQKYDSSGVKVGSEQAINTTTSGTQHMTSVDLLDLEHSVVVWSGNGDQSGQLDDDGVFARQFGTNISPTADAGGPYTISEGGTLNLDASSSTDPEGDPLTFLWDLDNDGQFDDAVGETPSVAWGALPPVIQDDGVYTIQVQVEDGVNAPVVAQTTLTINNTAPTLSATGLGTAYAGNVYTLDLLANDPGNDTISGWTINWGDGTIDTIAGNPPTATHTYNNVGFTNNITVSAVDEDGEWIAGELISSSLQTGSFMRFNATDGTFLQEFGVGDVNSPVDVEVGPDGRIYVTGFGSNNIYRYEINGSGATEFVSPGSGGLSAPSRLAFGPDGHLYVTSLNTNEVLRYDGTNGNFVDAFVSAGAGGLTQPDGIVFGPDGHLYVASDGTGQILRFDGSTGAFDQVFATHGSVGYMDLQFGPDGDLWVSNQTSDDIRRYDGTSGAFLGTFSSTGAADFAGIAFGPDNRIYLADAMVNDKIVRYPVTDGNAPQDFVLSGAGGLDQPVNIVFTPAHQVKVDPPPNTPPTADAGGAYTIDEGDALNLDASGSFDAEDALSFAWDLDNDGFFDDATGETPTVAWGSLPPAMQDNGTYTIQVRVDDGVHAPVVDATTLTVNNVSPTLSATGPGAATAGYVYTLNLNATDPGLDTITSWTINWGDGTVETLAGNPTTATHTYTNAGFTNNILVSATDEDGTHLQNQLLTPSFARNSVFRFEATSGAFLQEFANAETLDDPIEAVVGPDGRLYVSGHRSMDVLRYDAQTGAFIDTFISAGTAGLQNADGLAFGPDGHLYVADYGGDRVLRFDGMTGAYIDDFVAAASGGLDAPYDITFGPDGHLYVGSYSGDNILRYDGTTGAYMGEFVTGGSGGLDTPEQFVFGPDGHLYVSSYNSDEILRYDGSTGAFIDDFVAAGAGGLDRPTGLAFGPDGHLYVGDYQAEAILRYNGTNGAFIDEYVSPGAGGLDNPVFIEFLPEQQVTVSAATGTVANDDGFATDEDSPLNVPARGVLTNDLPPATPGNTLGHSAGADTNGDDVWDNQTAQGGFDWDFSGGGVTYTNSPTTSLPGITAAWEFDGTGGGTADAFQSLPGNPTDDPASFEIWFNPTDGVGQELIFETGGNGQGSSLSLDGTTLEFLVVKGADTALATHDISAEIAGDEFIHVIGVVDLDSPVPDVYLYVNGSLVDSVLDVAGITFWGNGNASGLGMVNGNTATANTANFDGQIAAFGLYESALDGTQVGANHDAIAGDSGSLTAGNLDTTGTLGVVALNPDGSFSYDPNGQFESLADGANTTDTFLYTADDGSSTDVATVVITITGVNDQPTDIALDNNSVLEESAGAVVGNLSTTDVDTGDSHTYTVSDTRFEVVGSQLKLKAGQSLDADTEPTVNLTVTSTDTGTLQTNKVFAITVTGVNEPPVADSGGPYTINEGASLVLDASASTDPETDPLSFAWDLDNDGFFDDATGATPTVLWGSLPPAIRDNGTYTIRVQVDDGSNPPVVDSTTLSINNVAPTGSNDGGAGFTTNADTAFTTGDATANDFDPAGANDPLTITGIDLTGTQGTVIIAADNKSFDYDPNGQFDSLNPTQFATDFFTYTVDDGDGGSASSILVSITVTGVNDQPTDISLDNATVVEDTDGAVIGNLSTTDVDSGDTHTYSVDDARFEVVGGQLKLKAGQSIDFEIEPVVNIVVTSTDSGGLPTNKAFAVTVVNTPEYDALWISTSADVTASGNPDLSAWDEDQLLQFGDPGLNFEPNGGTTTGSLSATGFKASDYGAASDVRVEAAHYVWSDLTVGLPGDHFDLLEGDLLLSLDRDNVTLSSNSQPDRTFDRNDVFVFRPLTAGDYTAGDFFHLLDDPLNANQIRGVSLVGNAAGVTVGDTTLAQGTFLLARNGTSENDRIYTFVADSVGELNTSGAAPQILLEGADAIETANGGNLGFGERIDGLHLVEATRTIGNTTVRAGDILVTTWNASSIAGTPIEDPGPDAAAHDHHAHRQQSFDRHGHAVL